MAPLLLLLFLPVSVLINGWALAVLWRWFLLPAFDLPALSIGYAIGLSVIASLLTYQVSRQRSQGQARSR